MLKRLVIIFVILYVASICQDTASVVSEMVNWLAIIVAVYHLSVLEHEIINDFIMVAVCDAGCALSRDGVGKMVL